MRAAVISTAILRWFLTLELFDKLPQTSDEYVPGTQGGYKLGRLGEMSEALEMAIGGGMPICALRPQKTVTRKSGSFAMNA